MLGRREKIAEKVTTFQDQLNNVPKAGQTSNEEQFWDKT